MSGIVGGTAQNLNVRNNVYDDDPGVLAWVPETQPLIKTDTLNVNSDVTDRAARLLGVVSGSVGVSNFPASYAVTGAFFQSLQPVSSKTALTASAPTAISVGVASAEAVAVNANRKGLLLVNTSVNYISLAFGAVAVLYSGITLNPQGGSFWMDEYSFTTAQVRAIASAAASNLSVQEFV